MALEIVTGFEIEAPLLPGFVSSSAYLNLRLFSTKDGNDLHDRLGALESWSGCLSLLPCLCISLWSS